MDERYPVAAGTRPWNPIDEVETRLMELGEVGVEVVGAVGDVMKALAASVQEPSHGGVPLERLEQFDGAHERDAYALRAQSLGRRAGCAGEQLERLCALLDGVDGNADVVDGSANQ